MQLLSFQASLDFFIPLSLQNCRVTSCNVKVNANVASLSFAQAVTSEDSLTRTHLTNYHTVLLPVPFTKNWLV